MTAIPPEWIDKAAEARLLNDPAHYSDCDSLKAFGTCDCTHAADVAALLDVAAVADWFRPTTEHPFTSLLRVLAPALDRWGHIPGCGYTDEDRVCDCAAFGERLHQWINGHAAVVAARTRREVAEEIAQAIEARRNAHWQGRITVGPEGRSEPKDYGKHDAYYDAARIARAAADQDEDAT